MGLHPLQPAEHGGEGDLGQVVADLAEVAVASVNGQKIERWRLHRSINAALLQCLPTRLVHACQGKRIVFRILQPVLGQHFACVDGCAFGERRGAEHGALQILDALDARARHQSERQAVAVGCDQPQITPSGSVGQHTFRW
ncbi:hypothetical protein D3C86_1477080 [compost metagenome]